MGSTRAARIPTKLAAWRSTSPSRPATSASANTSTRGTTMTRTTIAAAIAAAATVACGGGQQRDQQIEATHEASGASAAETWDGRAQLRLLGVNAATFGKAE